MRLTRAPHDPLLVFRQLNPQPSHAPPPCALANTSAAILTANRSLAETHKPANISFRVACGIELFLGWSESEQNALDGSELPKKNLSETRIDPVGLADTTSSKSLFS